MKSGRQSHDGRHSNAQLMWAGLMDDDAGYEFPSAFKFCRG